ncbi:uncharacterized protein LOC131670904 [Phymastichus coffea]|uniref:uncharacterized protein LOC131670904 n=1 Tax=Phymastichus coffea TaxID=108790 RepID=UPI00273BEADB|nr:uncharacterized protein LOC131670904 [Phymastichus coffea]
MQNLRGDVLSRLGGTVNQNNYRFPRVEFVNRAGERVNPLNGKPYNRPVTALSTAANGVIKRKKNKNNIIRSGRGNKLPIKTFGIMFGGLTPIPTNPTIDPPPRVCYNCWQPGHARKNCPRPFRAKICNNCGRRDEDLTTCPRCRLAHMRYLAHLKGEKVNQNDLDQLFPKSHHFEREGVYHEDKPLDYGVDETLREMIEQDDRDRELGDYYDEHGREEPYSAPQIKYVERLEYIKNPVSRYQQNREYEDEETLRRREDCGYENREGSYEETRERENFPRHRDRESSEDRSIERFRHTGNLSNPDLDSDPVQEVLQLAKSISHLSPETQDMIMKQVMAERKEKARLRAMTMQDRLDQDWP